MPVLVSGVVPVKARMPEPPAKTFPLATVKAVAVALKDCWLKGPAPKMFKLL